MKIKSLVLTLALGTALISFSGCKKSDSTMATDATNAATSMTDKVKEGTASAVDKTKEVAGEVADKTKEAAVAVADKTKEVAGEAADKAKEAGAAIKEKVEGTPAPADTAAAQTLIDKAKALVADSKYKDALETLQGLSSFKLTDEQAKVVSDLKEQIQKGLSAAGVSGLLGK